ncbi:hypothetical protein V1264_005047 [Littorina saxatilis]
MFGVYDKNSDGEMQLQELKDSFLLCDDADTPDGILTRTEYVNCQVSQSSELEALANVLYSVYDVNNNTRLDTDEYSGFYRQMDTISDGNLTQPEFTTYWTDLLNRTKHHTTIFC